MMAVPTHFYKVILAETAGDSSQAVVGAFVMPNAAIHPGTPLSAFAVPLSALEEVSGTVFFPKFFDDRARRLLDNAALQWQQIGRAELPKLPASASRNLPLLPAGIPDQVTGTNAIKLVPKPLGGRMQHICEHNGCRLPAERWWEGRKQDKVLRRTKSSPQL